MYKIQIDLDGQKEIYSNIVLSTGDTNAYHLILEFYKNGFYDITGYNLAVYARRSGSLTPILDVGTVASGKRLLRYQAYNVCLCRRNKA